MPENAGERGKPMGYRRVKSKEPMRCQHVTSKEATLQRHAQSGGYGQRMEPCHAKRKLVVLLGVTVTVTTACSGGAGQTDSGSESSPVVIRFWDENAGPSRTPYYLELFRRFEEQHPGIKVEYSGLPVSFNKQTYDIAISANDLPDVASLNAEWLANFVWKDVLLPLDEFYGQWEGKDAIDSSFISFNRSLAPDGKLYQLPATFYFDALWYRKDWFRQEGLQPPETWDLFFQAVNRLNSPQTGRFGYSMRGAAGSITQLTSLLYAYSGIAEYFTADGQSTIDDPAHLEFLQKYAALYGQATKTADILNGWGS